MRQKYPESCFENEKITTVLFHQNKIYKTKRNNALTGSYSPLSNNQIKTKTKKRVHSSKTLRPIGKEQLNLITAYCRLIGSDKTNIY